MQGARDRQPPDHWPPAALDAVLDAVPARVSWWDRDLRLRYANATMQREVFCCPRGQTRGQRMPDLVPWFVRRDAEFIRAALHGAAQQYRRHRRLVPSDGVVHREMHVLPRRVGAEIDGVVVVSIDITARMLAEEAARANEQLASVLEDRHRIATELHPAVFASCRAAVEQLARMLTEEPAPDQARQAAIDRIDEAMGALRRVIRTLRHGELEPLPHRCPGAPTRFLEGRPGRAGDQGPSGLSSPELLHLLDVLPMMITGWDRQYRNRFANQAAVVGYGMPSREALLGVHARELVGQAAFEASVGFAEAASRGVDQRFVRAARMPDGRTRHAQVDYVKCPVRGTGVGGLAVVLDITEQIQAEAAQRESAERVERLRDRMGLAAELHDEVLQRLFAAGLALVVRLQGSLNRDAIGTAIVEIDDALASLGASLELPVQRQRGGCQQGAVGFSVP